MIYPVEDDMLDEMTICPMEDYIPNGMKFPVGDDMSNGMTFLVGDDMPSGR